MPDPLDFGPQHAGDEPFTARMRFHQSWWRTAVRGVPYGNGPSANGAPHGNFLTPTDAALGRNFLTAEIFAVATARMNAGGGVERYRNLHNLLSSQPMCFNLFAPLCADRDLATVLIGALVPDVARVTDVRIEYAPKPKSEYLNDATSFDAFVEYVDVNDERCFIGIETKLTEPFSPKRYRESDREAYARITDSKDSPWRRDLKDQVEDKRWNQLWRNQMLVEALRLHPGSPHGRRGRTAIVRHPLDTTCSAAVDGYRALLSSPADLVDWPLDTLTKRWAPLVEDGNSTWIDDFRRRYVDLDASNASWLASQAKVDEPSGD